MDIRVLEETATCLQKIKCKGIERRTEEDFAQICRSLKAATELMQQEKIYVRRALIQAEQIRQNQLADNLDALCVRLQREIDSAEEVVCLLWRIANS